MTRILPELSLENFIHDETTCALVGASSPGRRFLRRSARLAIALPRPDRRTPWRGPHRVRTATQSRPDQPRGHRPAILPIPTKQTRLIASALIYVPPACLSSPSATRLHARLEGLESRECRIHGCVQQDSDLVDGDAVGQRSLTCSLISWEPSGPSASPDFNIFVFCGPADGSMHNPHHSVVMC